MGKIKEFVADHLTDIIIIGAGLFFILGCWWFYTANRTANDYNNATQSVEHLEKGMDRAGKRLESAKAEIANAEKHIKRADAVTGKLTERTERNKKSLTECEQLTDRMSKRTERIEGIIADIEQSNKSSGT
uniref:hypothetical protein n=1 Tax=uncultured Allisonella sp. TaxID=339338 RepID=UPI002592CCE5|nr:hypothetical protein [uncultured Allisonella sp.]